MNNTIEQKKRNNYELLFSTVKMLSNSQGYYGRLLNNLINMDEDERLELINNLPTFNDSLGVVMWLDDCGYYEPEKDDNTLTIRLISKFFIINE